MIYNLSPLQKFFCELVDRAEPDRWILACYEFGYFVIHAASIDLPVGHRWRVAIAEYYNL